MKSYFNVIIKFKKLYWGDSPLFSTAIVNNFALQMERVYLDIFVCFFKKLFNGRLHDWKTIISET